MLSASNGYRLLPTNVVCFQQMSSAPIKCRLLPIKNRLPSLKAITGKRMPSYKHPTHVKFWRQTAAFVAEALRDSRRHLLGADDQSDVSDELVR